MSESVTIPEPDYDNPKEVYAFFGLAYYSAAVLEHGVLNLAVALHAKEIPGVTVADVNRLYDSFDKDTFGRILRVAKTRFDFTDELEQDLKTALDQRNYLAHKFFVGHDVSMLTEDGQRAMIDELVEILRHVKSVDRRLDEVWIRAWEALGITMEWVEEQMNAYVAYRRGRST